MPRWVIDKFEERYALYRHGAEVSIYGVITERDELPYFEPLLTDSKEELESLVVRGEHPSRYWIINLNRVLASTQPLAVSNRDEGFVPIEIYKEGYASYCKRKLKDMMFQDGAKSSSIAFIQAKEQGIQLTELNWADLCACGRPSVEIINFRLGREQIYLHSCANCKENYYELEKADRSRIETSKLLKQMKQVIQNG